MAYLYSRGLDYMCLDTRADQLFIEAPGVHGSPQDSILLGGEREHLSPQNIRGAHISLCEVYMV